MTFKKTILHQSIRLQLFNGDSKKPCHWCGYELSYIESTLEHLQPESHGGPTVIENSAIACRSCNTKRGTLTEEEFRKSTWLNKKINQRLAEERNRRKRETG